MANGSGIASRGTVETIKISQHNAADGHFVRRHFLTSELAEKISRFNQKLSPADVIVALTQGQRIYTSFNFYQRA